MKRILNTTMTTNEIIKGYNLYHDSGILSKLHRSTRTLPVNRILYVAGAQ